MGEMTYRERREARAERLRGWAEKRETRAAADLERARDMGSVIPFGQPILAGHYSQGRDTRYRDRIGATYDRAFESASKAEQMRSKAANIAAAADAAIYSDDPDAVVRLEEKLSDLEAQRARIVAYNKTCRKGAPDASVLSDDQRRRFLGSCFMKPNGSLPSYALSNLSGVISTTRKRLEALRS